MAFYKCPKCKLENGRDFCLNCGIDTTLLPNTKDAIKSIKNKWKKKRSEIFQRDGKKCKCCGSKKKLTIDHIVPKAKGGKNNKDNLQVLCSYCNELKKDMLITNKRLKRMLMND